MRRRSFQHVRHAALTSESLLLQVQTGAFFFRRFPTTWQTQSH